MVYILVFTVFLLLDTNKKKSVFLYIYIYISAVKQLIASKIKVFLHNICVYCIFYYVYIITHSYSIYFENIYMYILYNLDYV